MAPCSSARTLPQVLRQTNYRLVAQRCHRSYARRSRLRAGKVSTGDANYGVFNRAERAVTGRS